MERDVPVVELRGVCKSFGALRALDHVDFSARSGEVTALVGDNGSGKSTLAKILAGLVRPDEGSIVIRGETFARLSARQAIGLGIGVVYQDLALDDEKDCAQNIFLGRELTRLGVFLDRKAMVARSQELIDSLGVDIPDVRRRVAEMSGGQRQALAMARAVGFPHEILVFDEPTSAMGVRETGRAMAMLRRLRGEGRAVILISHNLFQVFEVADRISVMSHGKVVRTLLASESSPQGLWDLIMGREGDGRGEEASADG